MLNQRRPQRALHSKLPASQFARMTRKHSLAQREECIMTVIEVHRGRGGVRRLWVRERAGKVYSLEYNGPNRVCLFFLELCFCHLFAQFEALTSQKFDSLSVTPQWQNNTTENLLSLTPLHHRSSGSTAALWREGTTVAGEQPPHTRTVYTHTDVTARARLPGCIDLRAVGCFGGCREAHKKSVSAHAQR